jgi:hypothetical protein
MPEVTPTLLLMAIVFSNRARTESIFLFAGMIGGPLCVWEEERSVYKLSTLTFYFLDIQKCYLWNGLSLPVLSEEPSPPSAKARLWTICGRGFTGHNFNAVTESFEVIVRRRSVVV